ncbi:MAG: hypothetical protein KGJ60_03740 [Verrucomicrobiota bacterium]|nr:hypothetical protein [Verrucomicrobiota bacterium]
MGAALFGFGLALPAAPMASPNLDQPGQPFTWAAYPTDEIGLADALAGTEITPSGSLYTGYGELFFEVGNPGRLVRQRIRTLSRGDLPIIHYRFHDGQVNYRATLFSWALDSRQPDRDPINYVRIRIHNAATGPRTTVFTIAFCYRLADEHRFRRPATPARPGDYSQPGVEFDPHWTYGFQSGSNCDFAVRSNQVVYVLPTQPQPCLWLTTSQPYRHPAAPPVSPATPVLLARYELTLKPDDRRELAFKMPARPIALDDAAARAELERGRLDQALNAAKSWWRSQLDGGMQLHIGEKKVEQTFRAALMYLLLGRERVAVRGQDGAVENLYVQTVNLAQYHAFWLRDGSYMVHAYDLTGHAHRAAQALDFFARFQKPDGDFLSQPGENDGWGQALWAYGQHFQLTDDRPFAQAVFPRVEQAVAWLEKARAEDALHVLPGGAPHDDELPNGWGHLTGDNFYALDGLNEAILMARALGHERLAAAWQAQYRDYHDALFQRLDQLARTNGGYIPPCLDTNGGMDWGNLLALYPHELLAPMDPLATGTLRHALAHYAEGIMCYGPRLHLYLTMNNTEAWIARGQQRPALRELYAILAHTSSTQAGWEVGPPPWTTRDFGGDLAPHNWFGADYIAVVRNMLLREQDKNLDLLSVLSPAWSEPGKTLWVSNAPTQFGPVSFLAKFTPRGMELHLDEHFRSPPDRIRLHLPWYAAVSRVLIDGHSATGQDREISLPPAARTVTVDWQRTGADLSDWSYRAAVQQFESGWRQHWHSSHPAHPPGRRALNGQGDSSDAFSRASVASK